MPFTDAVRIAPLNTHFASKLLFSEETQVPWIALRAGDSVAPSPGLPGVLAKAIEAVRAANAASPQIRITWVLVMITLLVGFRSRGQEIEVVRENSVPRHCKNQESARF